jgi:hypothetical protein
MPFTSSLRRLFIVRVEVSLSLLLLGLVLISVGLNVPTAAG